MKNRVFALLLVSMLLLSACSAPAADPAPQQTAPVESSAEEPSTVPVEEPVGAPVEEPVEKPDEGPAEEPAEPSAEEPVEESTEEPVEESTEEPVEQLVGEPVEESVITVEDVLAFVDQDVSAMYAALGEPESSSYEASCSGPGDDGLLMYPGIIVFTYREPDGSAETVIDAEAE